MLSPECTGWWLAQLAARGPVHPGQILAQAESTFDPGLLLDSLYHLLWHDAVQMDWQQPFLWRGAFHPAARIWRSTPPLLLLHLPVRADADEPPQGVRS